MNLYIGYLLIIFIITIILRELIPKIKGRQGERAVASALLYLPEDKYSILNNIMLKTDYGTTQIDHIVISVYGIFVIETKNYKGWITGTEFSDKWTKNMYGKKYKFRNPLKQNYAHVKALANLLNMSDDKFFPIVAFSRNSDIKINTRSSVIYIDQINQLILSYQQEKIPTSTITDIINRILIANIDSNENRKKHITNIQNKVRENNVKLNNEICPRCGGNLVRRNGKYGYFTGCSNYPNCKYTQNQ